MEENGLLGLDSTLAGGFLCFNNTGCLPGFYRLELDQASFERPDVRYTSRTISLGVPYWYRLLLLHFFISTKLITCCNPFICLIGMDRHKLELNNWCPHLPLPIWLSWILLALNLFGHVMTNSCLCPFTIHYLSRILLAIPMVSHRMLHNLKWCKKHFSFQGLYLLSRKALNLFGHVIANSRLCPFTIYCVGGPTYKDLNFNQDLVPALLCDDTYSQSVYNLTLTRKILVPVGHPQSPHKDIEWRESHSLIEIQMAGNFPNWVKQAYWAFKYTFQHCMDTAFGIKAPSGIIGKISSCVCGALDFIMHIFTGSVVPSRAGVQSYHLKTTLLWVLKRRQFRKKKCPYLLFMRLVNRLIMALENKNLPNYLIPGCNLLDGVPSSEIDKALSCLRAMQADPLGTMLSVASKPDELYGHNGFRMRDKLLSAFKDLDQNVNSGEYLQKVAILESVVGSRFVSETTICGNAT